MTYDKIKIKIKEPHPLSKNTIFEKAEGERQTEHSGLLRIKTLI